MIHFLSQPPFSPGYSYPFCRCCFLPWYSPCPGWALFLVHATDVLSQECPPVKWERKLSCFVTFHPWFLVPHLFVFYLKTPCTEWNLSNNHYFACRIVLFFSLISKALCLDQAGMNSFSRGSSIRHANRLIIYPTCLGLPFLGHIEIFTTHVHTYPFIHKYPTHACLLSAFISLQRLCFFNRNKLLLIYDTVIIHLYDKSILESTSVSPRNAWAEFQK